MSSRVFALGFFYCSSSSSFTSLKRLLLRSAKCEPAPSPSGPEEKKEIEFSTVNLAPSVNFYTTSGHFRSSDDESAASASLAAYQLSPPERPLSILLLWLLAREHTVEKYATFYLEQGYDVLAIRISPWQLLWPRTCFPVIEQEILPALLSSPHQIKILHGFSVGGFLWGQLLKYFHDTPLTYGKLVSSIKAQIFDSPVDVNGVGIGVSKALFWDSPKSQKLLEACINFHMSLFYSVSTRYYIESQQYFYHQPIKVPALFLCSKIDPICTVDKIQAVHGIWKKLGISCSSKIWNDSEHVGHMKSHPEEYQSVIKTFLSQTVGNFENLPTRSGAVVSTVTTRKTTASIAGIPAKSSSPSPSITFKDCVIFNNMMGK